MVKHVANRKEGTNAMPSSAGEHKETLIHCRYCGYRGVPVPHALPGGSDYSCPCCNVSDFVVLDDCDADELSIIVCRCCGFWGVPALNPGPSSADYPLCCPRCGDINDLLPMGPSESHKALPKPAGPGPMDIVCVTPSGPFLYMDEEIGNDWAELVAWMMKHGHWPRIWVVPSKLP